MDFRTSIENRLAGKGKKSSIDQFHDLCFLLSKEFGWSYDQIINTPIPFLIAQSERVVDLKKREQKEMKKGSKNGR